jgi:NADPH:quinone reductase-like Zn-dependent oxidoreductase
VRTEEAAEELRALGADLVLVDGDDLRDRIAQGLHGAGLRLAFDGVGGIKAGDLAHSLEFGATLVHYSSVDGTTPVVDLPDRIYKQLAVRGFFIMS